MNELFVIDLCTPLHVMASVAFLGLTVAQYFYIVNSARQRQSALLFYALRVSFIVDGFSALLIIVIFNTATFLVKTNYLIPPPAWILVAYWGFSILVGLWLSNIGLKVYYRQLLRKNRNYLALPLIFHISYALMLLLFVILIHDAVTRSTFLTFIS